MRGEGGLEFLGLPRPGGDLEEEAMPGAEAQQAGEELGVCICKGKSQGDEGEGGNTLRGEGDDGGKRSRSAFPSSKNRSTRLLELVHTDVHKVGTPTHSGYQYWVTFIDAFSRFRVVIPIKTKDMTFDAFKQFKAYAENQTGHKIKALRDDKGGEYMSNAFLRFTDECGIVRQHTV